MKVIEQNEHLVFKCDRNVGDVVIIEYSNDNNGNWKIDFNSENLFITQVLAILLYFSECFQMGNIPSPMLCSPFRSNIIT